MQNTETVKPATAATVNRRLDEQPAERLAQSSSPRQITAQAKPPRHQRWQEQPTRLIDQIKIGERHRKDFGDIASLARSIDSEGLLQPIAITSDNVLVAGERRLRAWKLTRFADQEIPVHVVDLDEIVRGEWSENANRKDFIPSEIVAIKRALEPKLKEEARERQHGAGDRGVEGGRGNKKPLGEIPRRVSGRAADKLGAFVGKDRKTIEKMEAVVAAAEAEPEKYAGLLEKMDKSGKVSGPFKRLQVMKHSEQIRREPPPLPNRGPYRVIVVDPPWPSEPQAPSVPSGRAYFPYPTMTIADICALPIAELAAPDCALWLWVTNFHMRYAFQVLDAWGFQEKTIVTWFKDKMGQGQKLRGQTEHCILATRGKPVIDLRAQSTALEGKVREHSQKPLSFYFLVEELCPASRYAELFGRGPARAGWDRHGDEAVEPTPESSVTDLAAEPPSVAPRAQMPDLKRGADGLAPWQKETPDTVNKSVVQEAPADSVEGKLPRRKRKVTTHETDIASAISTCSEQISELADECRAIVDNADGGLAQTARVQTFDSTAAILECIEWPAVPAEVGQMAVTYLSTKPRKDRGLSRRTRLDDALGILSSVIEVLSRIEDSDPQHEFASDLRVELEGIISEAECGCEFPGMFG